MKQLSIRLKILANRLKTSPLILVLLASTLLPIVLSGVAHASSGDPNTYPWVPSSIFCSDGSTKGDPTPVDCGTTYNFGLTSCPAHDGYCTDKLNGYYQEDNYGYQFANCTSYVAQKIAQEFNGLSVAGWGNASNWYTAATKAGYSHDPTNAPRVGDIAVWTKVANGVGHVAYVASVSGSTATFDEYNVEGTGAYTNSYTSTNHPYEDGDTSTPDYYIHIGTPDTGGGGGGGGNTTNSRPAVITSGSGNMNAFYRDTGGNLANIGWNYGAGGWGNTQDIVDPSIQGVAAVSSNPTAVQRDSVDMNVFYRDTNDNIMSEGYTSDGWQSVPSDISNDEQNAAGDPSVVSINSGQMDVFYSTTNGSLMDEQWTAANGWAASPNMIINAASLPSNQYPMAGSPAAISPDGNDIDVFYRDTHGDLVDQYWNSTYDWSAPATIIPGGVTGDPSVASRSSGYMDVVVGTSSGDVVDRAGSPFLGWTTTTFSGTGSSASSEFNSSGVSLVGNPTIVARDANDMDIFYQDSDGNLVDKGWNVSSNWAAPENRADNIGDNPAGVARDSSDMDIFSRSSGGEFIDTGWDATSGWGQTALGGSPD